MEVDAYVRKELRIDSLVLVESNCCCKHWDDVCVLDFDIRASLEAQVRPSGSNSSAAAAAAVGRAASKGLFVPQTRLA